MKTRLPHALKKIFAPQTAKYGGHPAPAGRCPTQPFNAVSILKSTKKYLHPFRAGYIFSKV